MLYTIAAILAIAWLIGVVTGNVLEGFLHILLVVAIAAVVIRLVQGRHVT